MTDILQDLYNNTVIPFFSLIPKLILAIVVIFLGLYIVKKITKAIQRILEKSGIDKVKDMLDDVDIVRKSNVNALPSYVISKFVYYALLLFIFLISADVLDIPELTELIQHTIKLLPNLLVAIIILVVGILVADGLRKIVDSACKSIGIPAGKIVASFVFFFVLINALMISLRQAMIPTDFLTDNLTVILGGIVVAFAIGYGLASKDMMSNFLASIYTKGKFNIGDFVTIDGVSGEIMAMDTSSLTILSNGKRVIFPLNQLASKRVEIHDNVT